MVAKRNRFALSLSAIMLIVFYAFVLLAAVSPDAFATPVAEGSKWVVGHLFGWGVIVFAFLLTAVYVRRANGEFNAMTRGVESRGLLAAAPLSFPPSSAEWMPSLARNREA